MSLSLLCGCSQEHKVVSSQKGKLLICSGQDRTTGKAAERERERERELCIYVALSLYVLLAVSGSDIFAVRGTFGWVAFEG